MSTVYLTQLMQTARLSTVNSRPKSPANGKDGRNMASGVDFKSSVSSFCAPRPSQPGISRAAVPAGIYGPMPRPTRCPGAGVEVGLDPGGRRRRHVRRPPELLGVTGSAPVRLPSRPPRPRRRPATGWRSPTTCRRSRRWSWRAAGRDSAARADPGGARVSGTLAVESGIKFARRRPAADDPLLPGPVPRRGHLLTAALGTDRSEVTTAAPVRGRVRVRPVSEPVPGAVSRGPGPTTTRCTSTTSRTGCSFTRSSRGRSRAS